MGDIVKPQKDNTRKRNAKADYNARHSEDIANYHYAFTERLKRAREAKNLTQKEAAKKLDISLPTYRKYEQNSGNRNDIPYFMRTLVDTFDVSADYLIGKSETPHPEYDEIIKTLGLNERSIQQLKKFHALDGAETSQGYLDFINCFLGNESCTSLFFKRLAPLLRNLGKAQVTSERMTNILSTELADCLYNYIIKVVVPTYFQQYYTGEYTPANVEQYSTDNVVSENKKRG